MHLQSQVSTVLWNRKCIDRLRMFFLVAYFLLIRTQSLINFLFKDQEGALFILVGQINGTSLISIQLLFYFFTAATKYS